MSTSQTPQTVNLQWQNEPREDVWRSIAAVTSEIEQSQTARKQKCERALRLYGVEHKVGDSGITHVYTPGRKLLALNIVRNLIDTVQSEICQNRPKPTFLTTRGDWGLQRKAKLFEQFVEGEFYESKVYATSPEVFRDALLFDGGVSKVSQPDASEPEILCERVLPWEILVPDYQALYGQPRHLYQRKFIDRAVLADLFPGSKKDIEAATRHTTYSSWSRDVSSDLVLVDEGWRLGNGKKPGKHAIVIENATLAFEDFKEKDFPFEFMFWSRFPVGFWGDSLANQLVGLQYELNLTMLKIQQAHHLLGRPHILWPKGCGTPKAHANNEIGTILEYNAAVGAPTVVNAQPITADAYRWVEMIYGKAHEVTGVSQSAAENTIPSGLTGSGKAQLVFENIKSKRFVLRGQAYEQYHVGLGEKVIALGKRIADSNPDWSVKWSGRRNGRSAVEQIAWKDAYVDGYVMKVMPTSMLPSTPAGRMATVESWINAGWIGREQGMRLIDMPDIESEMNLELASWDIITDMIERMLYAEDPRAAGVYQMPIPQMDLALAQRVATGAYLRARLDNAPEGNLALLLQFQADCQALLDKAEAEAMAKANAAAGAPAGPVAGPMPVDAGMPPGMDPGMPPEGMPVGPESMPAMG